MAVLFSYDDFILLHSAFRFSRKKGGGNCPPSPPPLATPLYIRNNYVRVAGAQPDTYYTALFIIIMTIIIYSILKFMSMCLEPQSRITS